MKMMIYNTLPVLERYFTESIKPKELLLQYLEWAQSEKGSISLLKEMKEIDGYQDFDILSIVRSDGIDILEGQQQYGLFNPTRNKEATKWCFNESERLQLTKQIGNMLENMSKVFPSSLLPEKLVVVILPADCANGQLMMLGSGLSCYGRTPGYLYLRIWPTIGNMERLGMVIARSFIHGIRRRIRKSETAITLGEAIIMEGLAASFVQDMFPDVEHPELAAFIPPNDWGEALSRIARYYGKKRYDDIMFNIYGTLIRAGDMCLPEVVPLSNEEIDFVKELVISRVNRSEANLVAAHLYGDLLVSAQGYPTYGIPHLAGFGVGFQIVRRYLKSRGIELASAISHTWQNIMGCENEEE
ncbi:hypothetical protein GSM42_16180 [Shimazuella sp. KC615]|uniref:DUF2268 domain-containing protein n=2 Tax=Shimazuella alba TaxID=2690964 RepID=A0A6I4VWC2_9BACL|nr:hypothetical protein [Shimazuella alba]